MEISLGYFDLFVIATYFLAILFIGFYYGKENFTFRSFTLGNKKFSTGTLIATVGATLLGGGSILGATELSSKIGWIGMIIGCADIFSKVFSAKFIAPRVAKFNNALTLGDIFFRDYGLSGKVFSGFLSTLFMIATLGAQIAALSYVCSYFIDVDKVYAVIFSSLVVTIYTTVGGIKSVVYTDVLQFLLLIITVPIMAYFCMNNNHISLIERGFYDYDKDFPIVSVAILFAFPYFHPPLIQRFLMAKNVRQASSSLFVTAIFTLPFYLIVTLVALIVKFTAPHIEASQTFFYALDNFVPLGIKGFMVAGLAAIIMSTADSELNCASTTFVNDVVRPLYKKKLSDKFLVSISRLLTFIIGIAATFLVMKFETVMGIIIASQEFWYPIMLIPFLGLVFNFSIKKNLIPYPIAGALLTMLAWKLFDLKKIVSFDSAIPAIFINLLIFLLCYFLPKPHKIIRLSTFSLKLRSRTLDFLKIMKNNILRVRFLRTEISYSSLNYDLVSFFSLTLLIMSSIFVDADKVLFQEFKFLRIIGIILCTIILFRHLFLKVSLLERYFYILWRFFLVFNFLILPIILLFISHFHYYFIFQVSLSITILMSLLSYFYLFTLLTVISAPFLYWYLSIYYGGIIISREWFFIFSGVIFSILTFLFVTLRSEKVQNERRVEGIKILGGAIAHEMRTPLGAIQTNVFMLKNMLSQVKKIPKEFESFPTLLESSSSLINRAQNTIETLLSNVKDDIDVNKLSLSLRDFSQDIIEEYHFLEHEKKCFSMQIKNPVNTVLLDPNLAKHVVFNLFKNAFYQRKKHGKGQIKILVSGSTLIVEDNIIGIQPDVMKKMYNHLFSGEHSGTGLGLSFCKLVMEKMGGRILCDSEYGKYTKFTLKFQKVHDKE